MTYNNTIDFFKNNKTSFVLIFFLAINTILFACSSPSTPEYVRTKDWSFEKLESGNIVFTAKAVFYNPNQSKARLREVDLDIFVNDKKIGKIFQTEKIKINGKSSFDIPLKMEFNLKESGLNIVGSLLTLLTNQKFIVDMKGFIKMNVFFIPFKVPIEEKQEFSFNDFIE